MLRGVLIGAGYFAQFHAEAWNRIKEARIEAVADSVPGKARAFADKFGVPRTYESVEAMLDEQRLDFVDITTRPEHHLELTQLAAARGIHVLCQKPMAPSWNDCVRMVEVCAASGVRLLMHENWRWQPWHRELKSLLLAGACGNPLQVASFWRTGDGRGPTPYATQPYFLQMPRLLIYETLVHNLDTLRFLFGEVDQVFCQTARLNPVIAGEDHATIQLGFNRGVRGLIDGNRVTGPVPVPPVRGWMTIEGDQGSLRLASDGSIWITPRDGIEREHPYHIPAEGYLGDSVRATQTHLVQSLHSGQLAESEGVEYLKTVKLVEACYESAANGKVVMVS